MTATYNLTHEPWIPCVDRSGKPNQTGLLELFKDAHHLREISANNPPTTAALHLLCLAVLQRVFDPKDEDAWLDLWNKGEFPVIPLEEYFAKWGSRFDIFDPVQPFYQDPKIGQRQKDLDNLNGSVPKKNSINLLRFNYASGDTGTFFDHSMVDHDLKITPGQAALILVTAQSASLGGMGTTSIGKDKYYSDSPSSRGVLFFIQGDTLFQTLMYNLFSKIEIPSFGNNNEDLPCWEMDDPFEKERRVPVGYLDFLTYQSRRLQIFPENSNGNTYVREYLSAPGLVMDKQIVNPFYKNRRVVETTGEANNKVLRFEQGRALWRDLTSLMQLNDSAEILPRPITWINSLRANGYIRMPRVRLLALGMSTEPGNKKVYFCRAEQFDFPDIYLENESFRSELQIALDKAQAIHEVLFRTNLKDKGAIYTLCEQKIAISANVKDGHKPDPKDVRGLLNHLDADAHFWATLEPGFFRFMNDAVSDLDRAKGNWQKLLTFTAYQCLERASNDIGLDAAGLKAGAIAKRCLNSGIYGVFPPEGEGK